MTNKRWDAALSTTTIGNPPIKNPTVVPMATAKAVAGDINIAIKIGTWLASVKEAGSITILSGENVGMIIPKATSNAADVMRFSDNFFIVTFLINVKSAVMTHHITARRYCQDDSRVFGYCSQILPTNG